ncbi:integral membrane protein [Penicillium brasilianum]|uniref:Integral membrane protein n=1 Tax=Penicillium brasilianum TaxID=104259 RepID=A0A1S9RJ44_PENBI|nr:integral membrane protein [Penicillium brasilianum]
MSTTSQDATGVDHDNLRHVVITSTCFAFILSTTAVGFRILSRKINGTGLYLDDYLMLSALLWEWGISIAGVVLLYNGLGTHIVYVRPEQLTVYLKTLFTGSILYTLCVASIKLSILMLYKRLFPVKPMDIAVKIVSLIIILWAACGILAGCFTCIPTEKLWNPMIPGGCMDLGRFYYGLQIPNIVTDAIILVMPMHTVWGLPISKAQKTGLSIIFILGFLTLIFDIVRLISLIDLSKAGDDITYTQVNPSVWTCIEPAVGIVAACLSNMRPLFKLVHRKIWIRHVGSTKNTSQQDIVGSNSEKRWTRDSTRDTPSPILHSQTTHSQESPA